MLTSMDVLNVLNLSYSYSLFCDKIADNHTES